MNSYKPTTELLYLSTFIFIFVVECLLLKMSLYVLLSVLSSANLCVHVRFCVSRCWCFAFDVILFDLILFYVCLANTMFPIQITHVWFIVHGVYFFFLLHSIPFHSMHIHNFLFYALQCMYVWNCLLRFFFSLLCVFVCQNAPINVCAPHTAPCVCFAIYNMDCMCMQMCIGNMHVTRPYVNIGSWKWII